MTTSLQQVTLLLQLLSYCNIVTEPGVSEIMWLDSLSQIHFSSLTNQNINKTQGARNQCNLAAVLMIVTESHSSNRGRPRLTDQLLAEI